MPDMFDSATRQAVILRLRSLTPERPAQWGRMNAPQMVAHLSDQMRHALGDATCKPQRGVLRLPIVRWLSIYWIPWPKGRTQGPPEAFVSKPTIWADDMAGLERLLERFAERASEENWPDHALFGRMTRRDWGVLTHKHFDHHLRQFGV
jgi:hypothetical protein